MQKQFKKRSSPQKKKISEKENKNLRKQIAKEFDEKGISAERSNPKQIEELEDAVAEKAPAIKNSIKLSKIHSLKDNVSIDINSCSIETLSELPGVTLILAKKAVNYRKNNNGFASVEEFYKVTNLKPHFIAKISDRVVCIPSVENTPTTDDTKIGRSLDL